MTLDQSPAPENTDADEADLPLLPEEEAIIDRLLDDDDPWHAIITALLG